MKRLNEFLRRNPLIERCLSDIWFKTTASLGGSFLINLVYAIWEIICGIYYKSLWFTTLGFYYILLMITRLILLRETKKRNKDKIAIWKGCRKCGILLLLMNFISSSIVVLAVTADEGAHYAAYLIYAVAAYTFYKVITAIRDLIRHRHTKDPIMIYSKAISFVSAMISLLSLEISMILEFGDDKEFFKCMTIITGIGVCVIISSVAIYMIAIAGERIKGRKNNNALEY